MRNIKHRIQLIPLYDHTTMEKQLERMAESGWMLEKITNYYWKYRRIEPKKRHFSVTYYPNASTFDPAPSEGEKSFQASCAEAGWYVAATSAKLQVFYNNQENPVPIETDPTQQVQKIHKSMKVTFLPAYFCLTAFTLYQFFRLFNDWKYKPIALLSSTTRLILVFNAILLCLLCFNEIIGYFFWYLKAKKTAKTEGIFVETHSPYRLSQVFLGLALLNLVFISSFSCYRRIGVFVLLWFCLIVILNFVLSTVKNLLKRKQVDATTSLSIYILLTIVLSFSIAFGVMSFTSHTTNHHWFEREPVETYEYAGDTWNIYHDTLPLTIEDLEDVDYTDYSYECNVEETVFLSHSSYSQEAKKGDSYVPNLWYSVTDFKITSLYDFCLRSTIKKRTQNLHMLHWKIYYKEVDASPWQADAAYQKYFEEDAILQYLLCYPDRMVTITFDEVPTAVQKAVIGEKLKGV